jgi:Cys-tRNA(Pro)/Cys-tRNA(Cys) deacylase
VLINGGQRGLLVGLAPSEAQRVAEAKMVDLSA